MIPLPNDLSRKWKNRDAIILEENEVDVKIACDCGQIGYIYESNTAWRCASCERVYRVVISVEQAVTG
jgi:hypothetical protein